MKVAMLQTVYDVSHLSRHHSRDSADFPKSIRFRVAGGYAGRPDTWLSNRFNNKRLDTSNT